MQTFITIAAFAALFALYGLVRHRGCTGHCSGCVGACGRDERLDTHD